VFFFWPTVLIFLFHQIFADFLSERSIVGVVLSWVFGIPATLFVISLMMWVPYLLGTVVVGLAEKWKLTRNLVAFASVIGGLALAALCVVALLNLFAGTDSPVDQTIEADEYVASVQVAFERFSEESDRCAINRDQSCLTDAWESLRDDVGANVPSTASWMGDAHRRLYQSLDRVLAVHERSEGGDRSQGLIDEALASNDELSAALVAWGQQTKLAPIP
jgi:hypothetical protein